MSVLGDWSPWSLPGGAVFGAGKSGRSLQRATRGGACECASVRARVCVLPARDLVCCCSLSP